MWPFDNERKKALRQFSKFVSPDVLEEILNHPETEFPAPQQVFIGYIIIQVRDSDVTHLNECITKIMDVIFRNGGLICDKTISLLVVTFGAPVPCQFDPASVSKSVSMELVASFPEDVKVIYGGGEALLGTYGHPKYMTFGPMLPLFSQRLEALCTMDYGDLQAINL